MAPTVRTALALQGGGALGAYEYGAIKALYEARGNEFRPDVITGISIGAINAAVLAGAPEPIPALDRLWREGFAVLAPAPPFLPPAAVPLLPPVFQQRLSLLGNTSMYRLRPEYLLTPLLAPFVTTSVYDTAPLRAMLARVVDPERLNRASRVVVTAVNVESGRPATFGNRLGRDDGGRFDNRGDLTVDHILASGSLPPGFPAKEVDGGWYWDGGLYSNTPLSEAINCLERCDPDSRAVRRELIVVELFPRDGKKPADMQQVMGRLVNILFAGKLDLDHKLFDKYSEFIGLVEQIDQLLDTLDADEQLRAQVEAAVAARGRSVTVERIRTHPAYRELIAHRRIDHFTLIPFRAEQALGNATDFSQAAIAGRIEAGYQEARQRRIGEYHDVDHP